MVNGRKVITICAYDSSKGQPARFVAFDESTSFVNPMLETYAVLLDGHYLLRTRNLDVDREFGIADLEDVSTVERRMLQEIYNNLPDNDFVLRVTSQSLIDRFRNR